MWNLAFLFLFILYVDGKNSNLCRMNSPRCDGDKIIRVDVVKCPTPVEPIMWSLSESTIRLACDRANYCDVEKLETEIFSCCGNKDIKKPKLRFVYDCVQEDIVTTKPTPPKMPTTSSVMNAVSTRQATPAADIDNFCVTNICYQKPYCSAGTEIAVMKITDSLEPDQVMNSLTYYCNKRQRCIDEAYIDNKCRSENNMKLHYICMKEKVTTTVMCHNDESIDNEEGQIHSSDYPNMIPDGTNKCRIKFYFESLSIMELFLIDLPALEVMYQDKYYDWSSIHNNASRHMFISPAYQIYLDVELNKLPQRRIWMYYRVLPTNSTQSSGKTGMPWTNTCLNHATTPEPMSLTTSKSNPGISEMSKVTMFKVSSSPNPSKDMNSMHKTGANQVEKEMSTAPHIVIPDGIPVDTEVGDKMEPVTIPAMPSNAGSITSSTSSSSGGGDVRPVEKPPNHPTHHEDKEKASSVSETPTTGLYSREVVIGLIAGVVILACLVIILLTALVASMRRRRRSLADAEERDEHNSGPGITTNENLVSFQYLKTLPAEGDNGTLGTRSQESEDSLSRDSTSKKSLITKPIKKKNSLAPSENESSKTADTISSKDDSVFHCFKNTDDCSNFNSERSKSIDSGLMNKNDNSFTGRNRLDVDVSKLTENHDGKDDDVFRDVPHFYVNGDDYALVQKDSRRSPRSTLIGDKSSIYANSSPRPKSGSSGSVQDSDVLEWTKGFNLAV